MYTSIFCVYVLSMCSCGLFIFYQLQYSRQKRLSLKSLLEALNYDSAFQRQIKVTFAITQDMTWR